MFSIIENILCLNLIITSVFSHITYIEVKYPLKGERSSPGSPWPLPQRWTHSEQILIVPESILLNASENALECDVIYKALQRYNTLIQDFFKGSLLSNVETQERILKKVDVNIETIECASTNYPKLGDDESYTIVVSEKYNENALIKANTIWGAIRGIETFSQLIYRESQTNKVYINVTKIEDWPRFTYRGLLIDTARHFIPINVLLLNLDAMAYNKFNVLHWHIVDDQSFPFESKLFPNLTRLSSYSAKHVYTQENIKMLIEEARLRGIRIIPEIDTPGHTQAFGKAFPKLLTVCYGENGKPMEAIYGKHAANEILNPTQNYTYNLFNEFFKEVRSVFPDEFIHLGMDEVYYDCWESNPDIKKFMNDNNMTKTSELEQLYVKRTIENVRNIGYKYMTWQDPVDNGVEMSSDTVVQIWKDTELVPRFKRWDEYIKPIAKKNYKMVLSSCWYLNYISYGQDWKKYYSCDPHNFTGTTEEKDLVIGGEACLWSEYVDGTNFLSRLWPRASAVAERLWSNALDTQNSDNAQFRLDEQRCRMLRRKIPSQPILNGFCGDYEWDIERPLNFISDNFNNKSPYIHQISHVFYYALIIIIVVFYF